MNNQIYIILSRPQLGENIGACARAMKNFGFSNLRIVSPRDAWPNEKAISASAGADDIILSAEIFHDLKSAIEDLEYIYATTAIKRDMNKNYVQSKNLSTEFNNCAKVGIIFGRENWGLSNEDISLANSIITIDTTIDFSSLNLAQSVLVICYELFKSNVRPDLSNAQNLASKKEMDYFLESLFDALDDRNFFRILEKKDRMKLNIRNIFQRIDQLSKSDIQTLRGIVSSFSAK
ncbi:MAG: RNA methyltransferase [Rickettsiaceae bacterium]|nr:RNA methyltransferase [Rickettsiaceae bacterium]